MRMLRFSVMVFGIFFSGVVLTGWSLGMANPTMGFAAEGKTGDTKAITPIPVPDPAKKDASEVSANPKPKPKGGDPAAAKQKPKRKKSGDTPAVTPIQLP